MTDYLARAREIEGEIIENRRTIHRCPEVGMDLPKTTALVKARLTEMGIPFEEICPCGIVATVGKGGKTILLRADMDALPMKERSGLPFASENDYGHTCGHDTHTAMLLGAAKLLKETEGELKGTVKLMFQPAEEMLAGAAAMVEAGLLENPHVDAAVGIHIASSIDLGCIEYCNGPAAASGDAFEIHVTGKGGHGSAPHKAASPINAACHIYLGLQEIIAREISARDTAVITVGKFVSGDKENIIPETAFMSGTIRTYSHEVRAALKKRLSELCPAIAAAYGCQCEVKFPFGVGPNVNDIPTQNEIIGYVGELLGKDKIILDTEPGMGSEDFAIVSEKVPAVFLSLGAKPEDPNKVFPGHNPYIVFNEKAFAVGAATYAYTAARWLENHQG